MTPWLDQIALPIVLTANGGPWDKDVSPLLDDRFTYHYRYLPLLFARAPGRVVDALTELAFDPRIRPLLEGYPPFARFLYGDYGERARALFDRGALPPLEAPIRKRLKAEALWER